MTRREIMPTKHPAQSQPLIGTSGAGANCHRRIVGADHAPALFVAQCIKASDHIRSISQRPGPRLPDDVIDQAIDLIGLIRVLISRGSGGAFPSPIRSSQQLPARRIIRIGKTMAEVDHILKGAPEISRAGAWRIRVPRPPLAVRTPHSLRHGNIDFQPANMSMRADNQMRTCWHRYARKHHVLQQVKTTGDHRPRFRIAQIEGFRIDIGFCEGQHRRSVSVLPRQSVDRFGEDVRIAEQQFRRRDTYRPRPCCATSPRLWRQKIVNHTRRPIVAHAVMIRKPEDHDAPRVSELSCPSGPTAAIIARSMPSNAVATVNASIGAAPSMPRAISSSDLAASVSAAATSCRLPIRKTPVLCGARIRATA